MLQILNNLQSLDEITFNQFKRQSKDITDLFPAHPQRVKAVGVRGGVKLVDETPIAWMFKIHSGTSNILYDAVLEFVGLEKTLEEFVKDKRLWKKDGSGVARNKLALEVFNNVDLRAFCSDPSDLYWGFHFIRSQPKFDAKYGDKQNISPDIRNPKRKGFFCKHLTLLFQNLSFFSGTFAKFLTKFYNKQIESFELAVKKRDSAIQGAAINLRKKEAEQEEKE